MPVTLEKVMRDMEGHPYELQMYCYHVLNGRATEAITYMEAYQEDQIRIYKDLQLRNAIPDTPKRSAENNNKITPN